MIANDDLNRIFIKGGVTSPGELKDNIAILEAAGLSHVHFGSRQDLLFPSQAEAIGQLETPSDFGGTDPIQDRSYQNIVSSYVSADIFGMTHWLKGSTYLYILEQFDYLPKLKINITDPNQRLVPLFNGNLNFIASESEDYWHLHVQLPHWKSGAYYPVLIYSWDIQKISAAVEAIHQDVADVEELFYILNQTTDTNNKIRDKELELPYITFPYYEGMNRMGIDEYWLGLYWRNNKYDLQFLKDFCGFCLDNSIGKICLTPWKSFVVKNIKKESRPELERFLGVRGINVRHSQLEMNWHIPVDDPEALELKRFLVRNFDQNDISTYGLTFGISNTPGKRNHFASVIIEKNSKPTIVQDFEVRPSYNVLHFANFDPNSQNYITYAQDVDRVELPGLLMELSKMYFRQLGGSSTKKATEEKKEQQVSIAVYQCPDCFTVYDETLGDPNANIAPNTAFEELPNSYCCTVCDTSKSKFKVANLVL